ncbi:MAG: GNAT family N-acetyltransferase [Bacillota bacterium]
MELNFKTARIEDLSFLAHVCREANYHYSKIMPGNYARLAEKFEKNGLPDNYSIYIMQTRNKNIGFLGFVPLNRKIMYLVGMFLLLDYQRQGYGSLTLKKYLEKLQAGGYEEAILLAHKKASWALDFYSKNRFTILSGNYEEIKNYGSGAMRAFALPAAYLMKRSL